MVFRIISNIRGHSVYFPWLCMGSNFQQKNGKMTKIQNLFFEQKISARVDHIISIFSDCATNMFPIISRFLVVKSFGSVNFVNDFACLCQRYFWFWLSILIIFLVIFIYWIDFLFIFVYLLYFSEYCFTFLVKFVTKVVFTSLFVTQANFSEWV